MADQTFALAALAVVSLWCLIKAADLWLSLVLFSLERKRDRLSARVEELKAEHARHETRIDVKWSTQED